MALLCADLVVTFMLSQSRTMCTLLPSQKPTPRHHKKIPDSKHPDFDTRIIRADYKFGCFLLCSQPPLLSCSAVQAEPCRATCANATLDMNFDSSFFVLTLLQSSFGQLCTRCTRLPSLGLRRVSTKKSYVKTHSRRQKFPNC